MTKKMIKIPAEAAAMVRELAEQFWHVDHVEDRNRIVEELTTKLLKALPAPEPELGPCPVCGEPPDRRPYDHMVCCTWPSCGVRGPAGDKDGAKWNKLSRQAQVVKQALLVCTDVITSASLLAPKQLARRLHDILNPTDESEGE